MNFYDLQKQTLLPIGRTPTSADSDLLGFTKQYINDVQREICSRESFRFMDAYSSFYTSAPYSTSTISVTNDTTAVTGAASVWLPEMVGYQFRVDGDEQVYTITAVGSNTTLTIDRPYSEPTRTNVAYQIYRERYVLPLNCDKVVSVTERTSNVLLNELSAFEFAEFVPDPESMSAPLNFYVFGSEQLGYSAGTVTCTLNSTAVTGSGTAWLSDALAHAGDVASHVNRRLVISGQSKTYTAKAIGSATTLTLERKYEDATTAGLSYTLTGTYKNLWLYPIPDDEYQIELRYYKTPAQMGVDTDEPDIPEKYHQVIVSGVLYRLALLKQPQSAQGYLERFENGIAMMSRDNSVSTSKMWQKRRYGESTRSGLAVDWNTLEP